MGAETLCLSEFKPGQEFQITELNMDEIRLKERIEILGFRVGSLGRCLYENAGKGSLVFWIQNSMIALRKEEAAQIAAVLISDDRQVRILLTGNPNVGKSTIFNQLTGMHQHTGNWTGKTVSLAEGVCHYENGRQWNIADLPGTYSLKARSEEERITAEALANQDASAVVLVCDASCMERNLRFLYDIKRICCTVPIIMCINLCDEAEKKGIRIDFKILEELIGCPVVPACASSGKGISELKRAIADVLQEKENRLLKQQSIAGVEIDNENPIYDILSKTVYQTETCKSEITEKLDRIVISPVGGSVCLMVLLFVLFWLTIRGADYPSKFLSACFDSISKKMELALFKLNCPILIQELWLSGIWKVCTWVVAVMLPPMAIFFPLFTLLEDFGYLPRVALHLDTVFKKCGTCGKQALTMCMGLGCNAAGITGCRIIDSKRERILAVLTNSFIPCNGRFPSLILLVSMFLACGNSIISGIFMCILILLSLAMTFLITALMNKFMFYGEKSAFILELPPYRRPKIAEIAVRSLLNRTAVVLMRAIKAAVPAGFLIWIFANVHIPKSIVENSPSLLMWITGMLNTPASWIGLDGCILFAFMLGFPANEIVIPAILMTYLSKGSLVSLPQSEELKMILTANGWTLETALCMVVFTLFHWPCATACLTVKKETGSIKWMLISMILPSLCGIILCFMVHSIFNLLHLAF